MWQVVRHVRGNSTSLKHRLHRSSMPDGASAVSSTTPAARTPRSSSPHRPRATQRSRFSDPFADLPSWRAMSRWHSGASARPTEKMMVNGSMRSQRPRHRSARRILCIATAALAVVSGCASAQPAILARSRRFRRPPPAAPWRRAAVRPEFRQCRAQPRSRLLPARRQPRHRPTGMRCRPDRRRRARTAATRPRHSSSSRRITRSARRWSKCRIWRGWRMSSVGRRPIGPLPIPRCPTTSRWPADQRSVSATTGPHRAIRSSRSACSTL